MGTRVKEIVRDEYDKISLKYEAKINKIYVKKRIEEINKLLSWISTPLKVLDVGGGTGHTLSTLTLPEKSLKICLDLSTMMVKIAKRRMDFLVVADGENLPFKMNCFDVVMSNDLIQYCPQGSRHVSEMVRVARRKGIIIITALNKVWKPYSALKRLLKIGAFTSYSRLLSVREVETLMTLMKGKGMSRVKTCLFLPIPILIRLDPLLSRIVEKTPLRFLGALIVAYLIKP